MITSELIAKLQDLDPTGDRAVMVIREDGQAEEVFSLESGEFEGDGTLEVWIVL